MAINQQFAQGSTQTIVTTTELVCATLPGINLQAGQQVVLDGYVDVTPGTSTTVLVLTIRRGNAITGTQVQRVQQAVTAPNRQVVAFVWNDQFAADVAGAQWCITVAQTGATANGNLNSAGLLAQF